jgi:steroid delta-isomerase-like uncharacterized protein
MSAQETFKKEVASLNRHDAAAFAAGYAPAAIVHYPAYPKPLRGTDAIKKDVTDFLVAFPDLKARVSKTVISDNSFAIEWSVSGTHKGPLIAPGGPIAATKKKVELRGAAIGRLDKQGRIAEERRYYDLAGLLDQLGLSD